MSENKVVDIILHCQKQIKKERLPEEKLLHYLGRLSRLRVTVQDLAETGIGRTVNSLSRNDGPVGQAADTLVRGWKRMVSEQQNQAEAERESEEESDSNSGSSEEEEEEEEVKNVGNESYEIEDQEETQPPERRYSNGHAAYEDCRGPNEPSRSRDYHDDGDDADLNDDIDDPYMENGFLSMTNVDSDGEDDEDEVDDKDFDSDASERLEIDIDINEEHSSRQIEERPMAVTVKQEKLQLDEKEQKSSQSSKSSSSSSSNHKSHESDHKKHSSSKSHRNHERSSEKSQSKELKHHPQPFTKELSTKDRSKHSASSSGSSEIQHKIHQSSSSKPEKSRESKSDDKSHHRKEKDKHHKSKESSSSSSHRDRDKESKLEKERPSKEKKDSVDNRSSSSSHKNKSRDPASSSTHSPKKSSLESSVKKEVPSHDDRKRKEHSSNSPCDSSSSKKSKLVLKEEIDSNSGVNFADVLGSLDVSSGSVSKHSGFKKEKRKEEHEKGHRKHHDSHHSSSSSSKKHDSSSSSKYTSLRDAGSSSASSSSKKYDRESMESSKISKKGLPQSKIESVIQPVVNISPNYKPMSSSLAKLARPGVVSSSNSGSANGIIVAAPLPIPLSHSDLSDLGSVDYWDNGVNSGGYKMTQEDAISDMLSSRNARSKVYSGVKAKSRGAVTSLFDLCMQVIKDNIGDLGYTGGIPYDILKPALERANPQQLICIESQNDYLIGETDELWQFHCKRDFRGKVPAETESWRELYERCTDERQQRFEVIKKKMKRTIEKAEPVRKAKLAYVDTSCGTRFNLQKAQTIKNGMKTLKIKEEKGPSRGVASSASAGFNNPKKSGDSSTVVVQEASVIIAPESRAGHAPAPSVSREASAAKLKPKKAPLMAKTMKLMKTLQRR